MNPRRNLLMVDADARSRDRIARQLTLSGEFSTVEEDNGEAALERVREHHFDAVLLEIALPDMDGRELCRLMRHRGLKAPIVMLSGTASEADIVLSLNSGAIDFVSKPPRINVLMARLRAHLREYDQSDDALFRIGTYIFRPSRRRLIRQPDQQKVALTEIESGLLKYLYRSGLRMVPRDELLCDVLGYNHSANTHTLETHIYRLRQKLETDPGRPEFLLTDNGGYRLQPTGRNPQPVSRQ